jgi:hypothetical protein
MKIILQMSTKELKAGAEYIDALQAITVAMGGSIELSTVDKIMLYLGKELSIRKGMLSYSLSKKNGISVEIDVPSEFVVDILELYRDVTNTMVPSIVGFIAAVTAITTTFEPRIQALSTKHSDLF